MKTEKQSEKEQTVLFLGAGGVSMSSLARMAKKSGMTVLASDAKQGVLLQHLKEHGVRIISETEPEAICDCDAVVYSLAIGEDHPQLRVAKEKKIPCYPRPVWLGKEMLQYPNRIGVAGMHGKSSTTAMLAKIFFDAKKDPCVLCGAQMKDFCGDTYRLCETNEYLILECCEYKDAFLSFDVTQALLLNLDYDHVDYFHSMEQIEASFRTFAKKAKRVVFRADDPFLYRAVCNLKDTVSLITFSVENDADYTATQLQLSSESAEFTFCQHQKELCRIHLSQGGRYQVENALAAAAMAHQNGIDATVIASSLATFGGLARRFEKIATINGADVYSDYAHHPKELKAVLARAREMAIAKNGRLICVFQSHTYSRSAALHQDFADAFQAVDLLYLLPIFAAREENRYRITANDLAKEANGVLFPCAEDLFLTLTKTVKENDTVLLAGAGDFMGLDHLLRNGV